MRTQSTPIASSVAMSNQRYSYYAGLLLAQTMVGINIVGSKYLLAHQSVYFILFVRFFIASVFLLSMHALSRPKYRAGAVLRLRDLKRVDIYFILAQALCAGVLFNFLLLLGLTFTDASTAGIITSGLPALIALMSVIVLRERLTRLSLLSIAFAVVGLLIINAHNFSRVGHGALLGDIIILLSLLPEATYYLLSKMYVNKLPIFLAAALMNAINLPFIMLALLFNHPWYTQIDASDILMIVTVGISSGLFYVFWFYGCQHVKGSVAGLFTAFMPIATLCIACLLLGEAISLVQGLGMLLVIFSILLNAKNRV